MADIHHLTEQITKTERWYHGVQSFHFASEVRCSCGYYTAVGADSEIGIVQANLDVEYKHRVLVLCETLGLRFPVTLLSMIEREQYGSD